MKTTTIISAALFSVTAMTASAFAQNEPVVPGSETTQQTIQNETRENVAQDSGTMTDAPPVANSEKIVPGSESDTELNEAATRDSIAAGTDAMGTTTGPDSTEMKNGSMDNAENPSAEDNSDETASPMEMQQAN